MKPAWRRVLSKQDPPSTTASVFRRRLGDFASFLHLFFLPSNFRLVASSPALFVRCHAEGSSAVLDFDITHVFNNAGDVAVAFSATSGEHKVKLAVLGSRIIFQYSSAKASLDGGAANQASLRVVLRIELAHCSSAPAEAGIQPVEEPRQSALRANLATLGIAKPLYGTNADRCIKASCSERDALTDVTE